MTIFTSSSVRRRVGVLLAGCLLTAGCDEADLGTKTETVAPVVVDAPAAAPRAKTAVAPRAKVADPKQRFTADFARAIAGARGVAPSDKAAFGIACVPSVVSAAAPDLSIRLPSDAAQRRHVFAVVTPERGLLEIYSPYGDDVETEELTVPSDVIAWTIADEQARFDVKAYELTALRRDADQPEALFIEPGRYRFALVSGIDAGLAKANGQPLVVHAGCTVDWRP